MGPSPSFGALHNGQATIPRHAEQKINFIPIPCKHRSIPVHRLHRTIPHR